MNVYQLGALALAALGFLLVALANGAERISPWLWLPLLTLFLLLGPAAGWVRLLRLNNRLVCLAVTVVASVSLASLVATAQAVLGRWDARLALFLLASVALAGAVAVLLFDSRDGRTQDEPLHEEVPEAEGSVEEPAGDPEDGPEATDESQEPAEPGEQEEPEEPEEPEQPEQEDEPDDPEAAQ